MMNKYRTTLLSGFVLLISALVLIACQPAEVVSTTSGLGVAAGGPPLSGSRSSETARGSTSASTASSPDRSAYFPPNRISQSTGVALNSAVRSLIVELTQFSDDHWVEMAEIQAHETNRPAGRIIRYTDDHWAEMAEIHGYEGESLIDKVLRFTDDHWAEMAEIYE